MNLRIDVLQIKLALWEKQNLKKMPQTLIPTTCLEEEWIVFNGSIVHSIDDNPLQASENKILGIQNGKVKIISILIHFGT